MDFHSVSLQLECTKPHQRLARPAFNPMQYVLLLTQVRQSVPLVLNFVYDVHMMCMYAV